MMTQQGRGGFEALRADSEGVNMATRYCVSFLLICSAGVLSGCPQGEVPLPPFDATGGYGGTFEASTSISPENLLTCRIAFDLRHDPATFFPLSFKLDGTVALNFTCASTLNALDDLGVPGLLGIEVAGALVQDGSFSIFGSADRSGRTYGILLDGFGIDEDEDGALDAIDGTFTLVVFEQSTASLELLELSGTFSAASPDSSSP
jgi:hypothetical protein